MPGIDSYLAKELEFDLSSEDETTRRNALLSLARMEASPKLLERIRLVATQDPSPEIRYVAKKLFTQIREKLRRDLVVPPVVTADGVNYEKLHAVMASDDLESRLEVLRQLVHGRAHDAVPTL